VLDHGASGAPVVDCAGRVVAVVSNLFTTTMQFRLGRQDSHCQGLLRAGIRFCSALSRLCWCRADAGIGQSKAKLKIVAIRSPSALLALTRIDVINSCSASV